MQSYLTAVYSGEGDSSPMQSANGFVKSWVLGQVWGAGVVGFLGLLAAWRLAESKDWDYAQVSSLYLSCLSIGASLAFSAQASCSSVTRVMVMCSLATWVTLFVALANLAGSPLEPDLEPRAFAIGGAATFLVATLLAIAFRSMKRSGEDSTPESPGV